MEVKVSAAPAPEAESDKIGRILNEKFAKEFGHLEDELNQWCVPIETIPGSMIGIKLNLGKPASVTKANRSEMAFSLAPVTSGNVEEIAIQEKQLEDLVVLRYMISYSLAKRIALENKGSLKPIVYYLLHNLKETKGYGADTLTMGRMYGTFKSPGNSEVFFRFHAASSAFELRLFSDCTKVQGSVISCKDYKVV